MYIIGLLKFENNIIMTDDKVHGFGPSYSWWHPDDNLLKLAVLNRSARKICRKCYCRLPLNSTICNKCKNPDIRYKKNMRRLYGVYYGYGFDKDTKNRMINK